MKVIETIEYMTVITDRIGRITREDSSFTEYKYDERNQLASASAYSARGEPILGLQFGYEYDSIGNMVKGGSLGDDGEPSCEFTANDLNQHETREWGGSLDVMGYASADATVTVNDLSTIRQGEWFYATVPMSNSASSAEMDITALAVYNDGTQDIVADVSGTRFISARTETPTYDARGNLVEDSRFTYQWDGWGRLISVESKNASPNYKLEFQYYPDGQRASKKYSEWSGGQWSVVREHQYVYNGWNLVYEKVINSDTPTLSYTNTYTWGLDISGQRNGSYGQSAGGIGGLIAITQVSGLSPQPSTYFPVSDHNGNIHKLIDESGDVVANYVYSPFGVLIGEYGDSVDVCPFRFSSKYYDSETELYYYGFRYYNPASTKWLSRDPRGETSEEPNTTCFVRNDPVNYIDPLGLESYLALQRKFHMTLIVRYGNGYIKYDFQAKDRATLPDPEDVAKMSPSERMVLMRGWEGLATMDFLTIGDKNDLIRESTATWCLRTSSFEEQQMENEIRHQASEGGVKHSPRFQPEGFCIQRALQIVNKHTTFKFPLFWEETIKISYPIPGTHVPLVNAMDEFMEKINKESRVKVHGKPLIIMKKVWPMVNGRQEQSLTVEPMTSP